MNPLSFYDRKGRRRPAGHGPSWWTITAVAVLCILGTAAVEGPASDDAIDWMVRVATFLLAGIVIVALIAAWIWILAMCWRALDEDTGEGR